MIRSIVYGLNNNTENYKWKHELNAKLKKKSKFTHQIPSLFKVLFVSFGTFTKFMAHFGLKRQVDSINLLLKLCNTTTNFEEKNNNHFDI